MRVYVVLSYILLWKLGLLGFLFAWLAILYTVYIENYVNQYVNKWVYVCVCVCKM